MERNGYGWNSDSTQFNSFEVFQSSTGKGLPCVQQGTRITNKQYSYCRSVLAKVKSAKTGLKDSQPSKEDVEALSRHHELNDQNNNTGSPYCVIMELKVSFFFCIIFIGSPLVCCKTEIVQHLRPCNLADVQISNTAGYSDESLQLTAKSSSAAWLAAQFSTRLQLTQLLTLFRSVLSGSNSRVRFSNEFVHTSQSSTEAYVSFEASLDESCHFSLVVSSKTCFSSFLTEMCFNAPTSFLLPLCVDQEFITVRRHQQLPLMPGQSACEVLPRKPPNCRLGHGSFDDHWLCGKSYFLWERSCSGGVSAASGLLHSNLNWHNVAMVLSICTKKRFSHVQHSLHAYSKFLPHKAETLGESKGPIWSAYLCRRTFPQLERSLLRVSRMLSDFTQHQASEVKRNSLTQHVAQLFISLLSAQSRRNRMRGQDCIAISEDLRTRERSYNIRNSQKSFCSVKRPTSSSYHGRILVSTKSARDMNMYGIHLKSSRGGECHGLVLVTDKHTPYRHVDHIVRNTSATLQSLDCSSIPEVLQGCFKKDTLHKSRGRGSVVVLQKYMEWVCVVVILDRTETSVLPLECHSSSRNIHSLPPLQNRIGKVSSKFSTASSAVVSAIPLLDKHPTQHWSVRSSGVQLVSLLIRTPKPQASLLAMCSHRRLMDECTTCSGVCYDTNPVGLNHQVVFLSSQGKLIQNKSTLPLENVAYDLSFQKLQHCSMRTSTENGPYSRHGTPTKNLPSPASEPPQTSEEPPQTSEEPPQTSEESPQTSEEPPQTSEESPQEYSRSTYTQSDIFESCFKAEPVRRHSKKAVEEDLPIPRTQTIRKGEYQVDEHVVSVTTSIIGNSFLGKNNSGEYEAKESSKISEKDITLNSSCCLQSLVGLRSDYDVHHDSIGTETSKSSPSALVGLSLRHDFFHNDAGKVKKKGIPKADSHSFIAPHGSSASTNVCIEHDELNLGLQTTLKAYNCNAEEEFIHEELVFEVEEVLPHSPDSTTSKKRNYQHCCFDKYLSSFVSQAGVDAETLP